MWALGDKIASTIVAQTLQIPTLPWSGSGKVPDLLLKKFRQIRMWLPCIRLEHVLVVVAPVCNASNQELGLHGGSQASRGLRCESLV